MWGGGGVKSGSIQWQVMGHSDTVVQTPKPYVGKLVVGYQWSSIYNTES